MSDELTLEKIVKAAKEFGSVEPVLTQEADTQLTVSPEFMKTNPFNVSAEVQKAIDAVMESITHRSYSERHPELGKMIKCQVCGTRHRKNERNCKQVFTYSIGDYEYFREDEKGEMVPDYRTCMRPDERATRAQVVGRQSFAKKRLKPHPSKVKLLLIEKTREIFTQLGFSLDTGKNVTKDFQPTVSDTAKEFRENLQRCRVLAARDIRVEREARERAARQRADQSRRINRAA